ncbi:hypothetical protein AGMMS4952_01890 [Spirochaetia bacterium]|nr:hypothetical protein AGMMS4952_01890 [Spirochaetia bacterium]
MKRIILVVSITLFVCGISPVFSQDVPADVLNNQYYLESVRLTGLARELYDYGDYDASSVHAVEALRYAQLSDEYVALQLKIKEANDAITAAKARIDRAIQTGANRTNPREYGMAERAYDEAISFREEEYWDDAITAARRVIDVLAFVKVPSALPAQYTVRTWKGVKDCLWNIAGRPWVYGDSHKWRLLYNANKQKLPDPNNPNIIEPGMVLDIPSLKGERREGAWDENKTYEAIR